MTEDRVEALKERYKDSVKKDNLDVLADCWSRLYDEDYVRFVNVKLKSPTVAVLLAVFLGWCGANRYYIGPTILGAFRLVASLIIEVAVSLILRFCFSILALIVCSIINTAVIVVYILAIVYSFKDCQTENYNTLVEIYRGIVTNVFVKKQKESILAIIGFVFSFFVPIVGLICSAVAYCEAKNQSLKNKGLAIAGIVISCWSIIAVISVSLLLVFLI